MLWPTVLMQGSTRAQTPPTRAPLAPPIMSTQNRRWHLDEQSGAQDSLTLPRILVVDALLGLRCPIGPQCLANLRMFGAEHSRGKERRIDSPRFADGQRSHGDARGHLHHGKK